MRVLLDTHALLWWHEKEPFSLTAGVAVLKARKEHSLLVSAISAWEIAVADTKVNRRRRPSLNGLSPGAWFSSAMAALQPIVIDVSTELALEAAHVGVQYGSHDPGDCLLLASAHLLKASLVTRDARMLVFAKANPDYLSTIRC